MTHDSPTPPDAAANFRRVCVALTAVFVVYSMLQVTVPVRALDLGASPLWLGLVFSAPFLLPLLIAIPMGGLINRWGGRRMMVSGGILLLAGLLVMRWLPGYPGLLIGQMAFGLAQMNLVLAAQSVVSGLARGETLERYFGWYTTWLSGGQVVGPLMAGGLIHWTGGTDWPLLAAALVALVTVIASAGLTGSAAERVPDDRANTGFRAQGRLLMGNGAVQVSVGVTAAAMFAMSVHGSYLPVYLEHLDIGASVIGVLVSLRAMSAMVIRPFMTQIIRWLGGRSVTLVLALGLLGGGLVLLGMTGQAVMIGLFSVLVGIGSGLSQPLSMVIMAENVSPAQRPGALAMRLMANRTVNFLAPLAFGALLGAGGFGLAFPVTGIVVAVAGALLWAYLRRLNRPS